MDAITRYVLLFFHNFFLTGLPLEDYSAVNCMKIFHHDSWPENTHELVDYGNDQLEALMEHFRHVLTRHVAV